MENLQSKVFELLYHQIRHLQIGTNIPEVEEALRKVYTLVYNHKISFELELEHAREKGKNEALLKMLGETYIVNNFTDEEIKLRKLLKTNILDLDIPVRLHNALRWGKIMTLGDLVSCSRDELKTFRNLGSKSLTVLDDLLSDNKLKWGMNVSYLLINER